jgi:hypothetical protein
MCERIRVTGERADRQAMKLRTEKWLLAEARWKADEQQPDGLTRLRWPEVASSVSSLLFMVELWWVDLPEQLRDEALKTADTITNYPPTLSRAHPR